MVSVPRPFSNDVPLLQVALVGLLPGWIKKLVYKARGAHIGKGVRLGLFSAIQSGSLHLGDGVSIAPFTFIRTRGTCSIGARSQIKSMTVIDVGELIMGEDSVIREQVTVGGMQTPRSSLRIGSRTKIFPFCFINPTEPITIGDEVCIGGGSYLFTHGTWPNMLEGYPGEFGPITIHDNVWLAWRSFVLPKVVLGKKAIIGAGAVVRHSVDEGCMAVGVPARVIKTKAEVQENVDPAYKHSRMLEWLQEFAALLEFNGAPVATQVSSDAFQLSVGADKLYYRQSYKTGETVSVQLYLQTLTDAESSAIGHHGTWLDLERYRAGGTPNWLADQLLEFLMRYGVRFLCDFEHKLR